MPVEEKMRRVGWASFGKIEKWHMAGFGFRKTFLIFKSISKSKLL
jgi:hypothetical protein